MVDITAFNDGAIVMQNEGGVFPYSILLYQAFYGGAEVVEFEVVSRSPTEVVLSIPTQGGAGQTLYIYGENLDDPVTRLVTGLIFYIGDTPVMNFTNLALDGGKIGATAFDSLFGGRMGGWLYILGGDDNIQGARYTDYLIGYDGSDLLFGNGGDDYLYGDGPLPADKFDEWYGGERTYEDYLDGGSGADFMHGGFGNDIYIVDNVKDKVVETNAPTNVDGLTQGEADQIYSYVSYSLAGTYVEQLFLYGSDDTNATGNSLDNTLGGNAGKNVLTGGKGNDRYFVGAGDSVVERANEGTDTVFAYVSFSLAGQYLENLYLFGEGDLNGTGNSLDNELVGNAGRNTLTGGSGNDRYFIQTVGDKVIEADRGGTDTVHSSVSFSLAGQFIENLFLTGDADINALGNSLNNFLSGNLGKNELRGGKGDDIYYVQTVGDRVIEKAGEGDHDFVYSTIDFSLSGQFVEELWLVGEEDIDGSGNSLDNTITGNDGVNILRGYSGDDTYYIQTAGDRVIEAKDAGHDTVFSTVSFSLAGQYIEDLTLEGLAEINGAGNSFDNVLTGNLAKNILSGGRGDDTYFIQSYIHQNAQGQWVEVFDDVRELAGEGTDRIFTESSYTLAGRYVEELWLTGARDVDATGNSLANVLKGNSGANTIYGGGGMDRMTGGGGVDTFIWKSTGDSIAGTSDRVLDLEAHDVLDLSAIDGNTTLAGNQAFQLVSSFAVAATNGAGRAVLKYDAANSWTLLELDVNNDGRADSRIVLMGDHTGHAAWAL